MIYFSISGYFCKSLWICWYFRHICTNAFTFKSAHGSKILEKYKMYLLNINSYKMIWAICVLLRSTVYNWKAPPIKPTTFINLNMNQNRVKISYITNLGAEFFLDVSSIETAWTWTWVAEFTWQHDGTLTLWQIDFLWKIISFFFVNFHPLFWTFFLGVRALYVMRLNACIFVNLLQIVVRFFALYFVLFSIHELLFIKKIRLFHRYTYICDMYIMLLLLVISFFSFSIFFGIFLTWNIFLRLEPATICATRC